MAKRKSTSTKNITGPTAPTRDRIERNVVRLAEQLGRLIGTVQARADGLIDRDALSADLAAIRDAAANLATQARGGRQRASATTAAAAAPPRRSRGAVDAPGKRHRKPLPSTRGAKHSDTRIAKVKLAKEGRPPRRS
jgi:hypothetical protein